MKNKPCSYALYTLIIGTLLPITLCITYIACLWNSHTLSSYFFIRQAAEVVEATLGCIIFAFGCAFLWEQLYRRYCS